MMGTGRDEEEEVEPGREAKVFWVLSSTVSLKTSRPREVAVRSRRAAGGEWGGKAKGVGVGDGKRGLVGEEGMVRAVER